MELIRKSSGEEETFSLHKLIDSLKKSGADEQEIDAVIDAINERRPKTTEALHTIAFETLQALRAPVAARYNLKRALMEFGPAGFPFEKYVGHLFSAMGYSTQIDAIIQGLCVEHEVDVLANKGNHHAMIECKFHNRPGLKSDVKIPLYIKARFDDIAEGKQHQIHEAWIVCNTTFTSRAIQYAHCRSLKLLAWNYPVNHGLAHLIEKFNLHPITALTSLSHHQKTELLKQGIVLCRDAAKHPGFLHSFGFTQSKIDTVLNEAHAICTLD